MLTFKELVLIVLIGCMEILLVKLSLILLLLTDVTSDLAHSRHANIYFNERKPTNKQIKTFYLSCLSIFNFILSVRHSGEKKKIYK